MNIKVIRNTVHELSQPLHFYFAAEEVRCHCGKCRVTLVSTSLVEMMEDSRRTYGAPLFVSSGYRCQAHNKDVLGKDHSWHVSGNAVDFILPQHVEDQSRLFAILKDHFPYVELHEAYVHCDTRGLG